MKKKVTLRRLNNLIQGYNMTSAERRETLLCLSALQHRGIEVYDVIKLDGEYYMLGLIGLYDCEMSVTRYTDIGFEYLETYAKKCRRKYFYDRCVDDFPSEIVSSEYHALQLQIKDRWRPKDLKDSSINDTVNARDKLLAKLEEDYKATLKNVDRLSSALLKQVRENKSLKRKLGK